MQEMLLQLFPNSFKQMCHRTCRTSKRVWFLLLTQGPCLMLYPDLNKTELNLNPQSPSFNLFREKPKYYNSLFRSHAWTTFSSDHCHWRHWQTVGSGVMLDGKINNQWRRLFGSGSLRYQSKQSQVDLAFLALSKLHHWPLQQTYWLVRNTASCNIVTDLCKFSHPAVRWILRGSCSAPPWLYLYMSCRSHHCSQRRSLKTTRQRWKRRNRRMGCKRITHNQTTAH